MFLLGLVIALVIALVPVDVSFGDDPLLRLRELDPQLSPPTPTAECGSPLTHLGREDGGTTFYGLAKADACERAVRRRVLIAVAVGGLTVAGGILLLIGAGPASAFGPRRPGTAFGPRRPAWPVRPKLPVKDPPAALPST